MDFFDFCAGIGGGRLGVEKNGLNCVGHSEIDLHTSQTYNKFFNDDRNYGDLTTLNIESLPNFEFMIAGFPCQTFSIVGKREGLKDSRGQIIYSLIEIMKKKNIKYFILENVKGLVNHDKGKTFKTIQEELSNTGYNIYWKVLNSIDYGVPQMRERVYIVGFRKDIDNELFEFPKPTGKKYKFLDFIDEDNTTEFNINNSTFQRYLNNKYNILKYGNVKDDILNWENCVIDWRQSDLRKYKEYFPTLRKGRHGLLYIHKGKIKKLNGYESLLLQGFPKKIAEKVKNDNFFVNGKVLSQSGNAMTVSVIDEITKSILKTIKKGEN